MINLRLSSTVFSNLYQRIYIDQSNLDKTIFTDCIFDIRSLIRDSKLYCSKYENVLFLNSTFDNCDFTKAYFHKCMFNACTFNNLNLDEAIFQECDFKHSIVKPCNLEYSNFLDCKFDNCRFY